MPPLILVGLPGAGAGGPWFIHWNSFFAQLLREYRVAPCYGMGSNVYRVRNDCMPAWDKLPYPADYMLWIDSDNLFTYEMFKTLRASLESYPGLDVVAGWSWVQDVMGNERPKISAGQWKDSKPVNLQYREILTAKKAGGLLLVQWTGLSFALIRAESLKRLGPEPFMPIPEQDDDGTVHLLSDSESFCYFAGQMGLKFAVHPGVKTPHLKPKPIEPDIQARIEMEGPEVITQGYQEETGEPEPEEVPT